MLLFIWCWTLRRGHNQRGLIFNLILTFETLEVKREFDFLFSWLQNLKKRVSRRHRHGFINTLQLMDLLETSFSGSLLLFGFTCVFLLFLGTAERQQMFKKSKRMFRRQSDVSIHQSTPSRQTPTFLQPLWWASSRCSAPLWMKCGPRTFLAPPRKRWSKTSPSPHSLLPELSTSAVRSLEASDPAAEVKV